MPHLFIVCKRPAVDLAAAAVAFCLFCFTAAGSAAEPSKPRAFDIAAGDAVSSLKQFAAQADARVLYSVDAVQGVQTNLVKGSFAPRDALTRLVAGTPLNIVHDEKTGALGIQRQSPSPAS